MSKLKPIMKLKKPSSCCGTRAVIWNGWRYICPCGKGRFNAGGDRKNTME